MTKHTGTVAIFRDHPGGRLRAVPGIVCVPRGGKLEIVNVNEATDVKLHALIPHTGPTIRRANHLFFHIAETARRGIYKYKAKSKSKHDYAVGNSDPKIIIYDP